LLCFSLLPQILAALNFTFHKPPSLSFLSFLSEGHVQRRPPESRTNTTVTLAPWQKGTRRKRNPPCPGHSYDPRDGGSSPFSPEKPNSATPRSITNPVRYPLFLAHYLVSAVRGGVETKGQRHQPTGHPATVCSTSPVSSTPQSVPVERCSH